MEYNQDFINDVSFYETLWDEESKIRLYLDDNLLFRGKPISNETLCIYLNIYPKDDKCL